MDVNVAIDINPKDKKILFSLLAQYLPHTPVWVYGSRFKGIAKPWSDIDIVVFTGEEHKYQLSLLREALEESNLSIRAQILEWDLLPDSFKTSIAASHAVIA